MWAAWPLRFSPPGGNGRRGSQSNKYPERNSRQNRHTNFLRKDKFHIYSMLYKKIVKSYFDRNRIPFGLCTYVPQYFLCCTFAVASGCYRGTLMTIKKFMTREILREEESLWQNPWIQKGRRICKTNERGNRKVKNNRQKNWKKSWFLWNIKKNGRVLRARRKGSKGTQKWWKILG